MHGAATMAALPSADAVLLVSDASQEYTAPELEFVRQAIAMCPNVACVLTKIDIYPEWRRIAEIDIGPPEGGRDQCPMFAGVLGRALAEPRRDDQPELDAESGFPELVRFLREQVVGQADMLARRSHGERRARGDRPDRGRSARPSRARSATLSRSTS